MSTSHPVIIERIRIGLLIASLTLLAACSATNPGASVQPSITKEAAQVRILEYFADTLAVLRLFADEGVGLGASVRG